MLKKYFISILALTSSITATFAQSAPTTARKVVMVLPYNPLYYMSDADKDIAEQTNEPIDAIHLAFNTESERKLHWALKNNFECLSLLQDSSPQARKDLATLMQMMQYSYDAPTVPLRKASGIANNITFKTTANNNDSRTAASYVNENDASQYMKALPGNEKVFSEIMFRYKVERLVVLTQIEIKTNMKVCTDARKQLYDRQLILHFTVLNKHGKVVYGNYAHTFFSNDKSSAGNIIGNLFPFIADVIALKVQQN